MFKSSNEKRFWMYASIVLVAILSTLILGRPLQEMLRDQNVQAIFFLFGLLLTSATITVHGLKVRPAKIELVVWPGMIAVYTMLIFRLGAPERSHLIEYSVLAIFIHKALIERYGNSKVLQATLLAFLITSVIGMLDEVAQKFLPNRVFDPEDIVFNSLASFMAIGGSTLLNWVKNKFRKAQ